MKLKDLQLTENEKQLMKDIVDPLYSAIRSLFPNSYLSVIRGGSVMDEITIRFSVEPKDKWPNNIFHNAQYTILLINEKGTRKEVGEGPYEVELLSSHIKDVKFRKKSGSLDQIVNHIVKYFSKIKSS